LRSVKLRLRPSAASFQLSARFGRGRSCASYDSSPSNSLAPTNCVEPELVFRGTKSVGSLLHATRNVPPATGVAARLLFEKEASGTKPEASKAALNARRDEFIEVHSCWSAGHGAPIDCLRWR